MLHLRAICPPELTEQVLRQLEANPAVTHLCVSPGAARKPAGDVVSCDVAREAATAVIEDLRDRGLERRGGLVVETVDITMSEAAEQAERDAPGDPADALVWEDIEQSAGEETRLSVTYLAFMIVATVIASVGVMLDQPILIVGPWWSARSSVAGRPLRQHRQPGAASGRRSGRHVDAGLCGWHHRDDRDYLGARRGRADRGVDADQRKGR
jgi:hypothetical protein